MSPGPPRALSYRNPPDLQILSITSTHSYLCNQQAGVYLCGSKHITSNGGISYLVLGNKLTELTHSCSQPLLTPLSRRSQDDFHFGGYGWVVVFWGRGGLYRCLSIRPVSVLGRGESVRGGHPLTAASLFLAFSSMAYTVLHYSIPLFLIPQYCWK